MAGIYSQGGSAGHRYAGWLETVEAKNFQFGGKVFNGSPSAIYVGSNLVWMGLGYEAKQAILGAFGQRDGTAVIKATNAYLNQLAASDMDKATALAGFINEDPMMVCSLGLEVEGVTMPIRVIGTTDGAYINTEIIPNNYSHYYQYETEWEVARIINNTCILGAVANGSAAGNVYFSGSDCQVWGAYNWVNTGLTFTVAANTRYYDFIKFDIDNNKGYRTLNGSSLEKDVDMRARVTIPFFLFAYNNAGSPGQQSQNIFARYKFEGDGVSVAHMIPCKHNGQNGMYDIERMRWFGNANSSGSFTIPDISYTPSTP